MELVHKREHVAGFCILEVTSGAFNKQPRMKIEGKAVRWKKNKAAHYNYKGQEVFVILPITILLKKRVYRKLVSKAR